MGPKHMTAGGLPDRCRWHRSCIQ